MSVTDRGTLTFIADVIATGGLTDANVERVARHSGTSIKAAMQIMHALGWLGGGSGGGGGGGLSSAAVTALVKSIVATDPACVGPQGPAGPQGPQGVPGPAGATGTAGPAGANGVTFVPAVDPATGTLSWSNAGGLPNPAPVVLGGLAPVGVATLAAAGVVKPDGRTITIDPDGTLHAVAAAGSITVTDLSAVPGSFPPGGEVNLEI